MHDGTEEQDGFGGLLEQAEQERGADAQEQARVAEQAGGAAEQGADAFVRENAIVEGTGGFQPETCMRVATLERYGSDDASICKTLFLTNEQLAEIRHTEAYVTENGRGALNDVEHAQAINEGWNGVERLGVQIVRKRLEMFGASDPKFALLAASMASKARRIGGVRGQQPLQVQASNVVLNLSPMIIQQLRGGGLPVQGLQVPRALGTQPGARSQPTDPSYESDLANVTGEGKTPETYDADEMVQGIMEMEIGGAEPAGASKRSGGAQVQDQAGSLSHKQSEVLSESYVTSLLSSGDEAKQGTNVQQQVAGLAGLLADYANGQGKSHG